MADGDIAMKEISFGDDFGPVAVKVNGVRIEVTSDGGVQVIPVSAPDAFAKSAPQIGEVTTDGALKGFIYAGIPPGESDPLWVRFAAKLMDHFDAAAWAAEQGGRLPTLKQGEYLDTIKNQRALKSLFNRSSDTLAGCFWLEEVREDIGRSAWCQALGHGDRFSYERDVELQPLCARI